MIFQNSLNMYKSKQHRLLKNYLDNGFDVVEKKEYNHIKRRTKSAIKTLHESKYLDNDEHWAAMRYQKAYNRQGEDYYPTIDYSRIRTGTKIDKEDVITRGSRYREEIEEIRMMIGQYQHGETKDYKYLDVLTLAFDEDREIKYCANKLNICRNTAIKKRIKEVCNIIKDYYLT